MEDIKKAIDKRIKKLKVGLDCLKTQKEAYQYYARINELKELKKELMQK